MCVSNLFEKCPILLLQSCVLHCCKCMVGLIYELSRFGWKRCWGSCRAFLDVVDTLSHTDEAGPHKTPCRREGTNWVNHSSVFYNSLKNWKNKFASLSRLTCKELKEFVFLSWQSKSPSCNIYIALLLLLIVWPNGALWMVDIHLQASTCVCE
jgi:hypothetical protein